MVLPNFVGLGAQRAATTWIYECLREHPNVFVPEAKELAFFNWNYDKGLEWYAEQFATHSGQKAVGEITPGYLNSEPAVRRMADLVPDARLFIILREPIRRAYSAYQLLQDRYRGVSFQEACSESSYLVRESLYADGLERLYRLFRSENIKVLLYDDIQADPAGAIAGLFRFLDVDPGFRPTATGKIYNRAILPRTQKSVDRLGLGWTVRLIKKTPIGDMIKRYHRARAAKATDVGISCFPTVKNLFRDDLVRVESLIGRDLSHWLNQSDGAGARGVETTVAYRSTP